VQVSVKTADHIRDVKEELTIVYMEIIMIDSKRQFQKGLGEQRQIDNANKLQ